MYRLAVALTFVSTLAVLGATARAAETPDSAAAGLRRLSPSASPTPPHPHAAAPARGAVPVEAPESPALPETFFADRAMDLAAPPTPPARDRHGRPTDDAAAPDSPSS
jgi:hypothetical protein